MKRALVLMVLWCVSAVVAEARVLSYAPYTSRAALPAVQHRTNRYFALTEFDSAQTHVTPGQEFARLVLYDARGDEPPRVIYDDALIVFAAVHENASGVPSILVHTTTSNGAAGHFHFSSDAGRTWQTLASMPNVRVDLQEATLRRPVHDSGGPIARGQSAPVHLGTDAVPFVVATGARGLWSIDAGGRAAMLGAAERILGGSGKGERLLAASSGRSAIELIDVVSRRARILTANAAAPDLIGWVTDGGVAMLHRPLADGSGSSEFLGGRTSIGLTLNGRRYAKLIVAPTADYSGAWIAHVDRDRYTTLSLFTPEEGLEVQWEDAAGPDIEALHAGRSGNTLLVQVHRERPLADQRVFVDPALAIWTRGEGAPQGYDELYMNEQNTKGFVHLDVDRAAAGAPFVFDAGLVVMVPTYYPGMPPPTFPMPPTAPNPPPTAGGGDVVQEWGVARASLKQRLVLPAIGRTPGANGSNWRSDVILSNPVDAPQRVTLRFAANGAGGGAAVLPVATITLAPQEIRLIPDALQTLFDRESGSGALFLDPEFAINASSRTYTTSARGTYGFNMNAVDTSTGFGPRFPASFAAAISGTTSRSNLVLTDVSESGIDVELRSRRPQADDAHLTLTSPAIRQLQLDHLARQFDLGSSGEAALDVTSRNGFVIPSLIAVDNGTNDPTYFPADSSTARMRMIPALGSVMGPNGARYVSDLHFYNASDQPAGMTIQAKRWDSSESKTFSVALAPNETLVWRDVVRTKFNQSGIVRARMQASGNVRVTSRTYTVDPVTGGTYGFALPPLNNFQIAAPGDTLEILGAVIDPRFRTNLALVDTAVVNRVDLLPVHVEIVASGGEVLRAFDTNVQTAGGTQLVDLFRGIDVPSPAAVLIRVSPRAGLVAAFATIIDNQTNDPGYLAANLGAKTN